MERTRPDRYNASDDTRKNLQGDRSDVQARKSSRDDRRRKILHRNGIPKKAFANEIEMEQIRRRINNGEEE